MAERTSVKPELTAQGFILQASYRIFDGRPVVHLFGRLTTGETFLVRDSRQTPHFYIPLSASDHSAVPEGCIAETSRQTFAGTPVARVNVPVPQDAPPLRDRLHQAGVPTFEGDVRFAVRYLIDRGIQGGCQIKGQPTESPGVDLCFDNPELTAARVRIEPTVLAFDIETNPATQRLLAISWYGCGADEVVIVDADNRAMPERATGVATEAAALRYFANKVRELNPDVITGWNVIDFDLSFLQGVAERLGLGFSLGRGAGDMRIRKAEGYFGSGQATIPGRLVLDGLDLVRGAFIKLEEYSLDSVARVILGEGKALHGDSKDRLGEILDGHKNNLPDFALYARTDSRLALEIVEKLDLVKLAVERSALTGMTPDRVSASIASFDFLYLAALYQRRVVAPSVQSSDSRVHAASAGGHVLASQPGMHKNVWVFDFQSLYPSIIRTFNIDPIGFHESAAPDLIDLPGNAWFSRDAGILPAMLDDLFPRRAQAKREGNEVASQAIKILMNSFYGVLGTPACRFYNPNIANAITGQGRYLLLWSKAWFEAQGYEVLYGDTDSLFVSAGTDDSARAHQCAQALAETLSSELAKHIAQKWRVTSRLTMEFEKLYERLFLPHVRHGTGGARKRYVGSIYQENQAPEDSLDNGSGQRELDFVGMEVVRRDWTQLAKTVQRELYQRLFAGEAVDEFLITTVQLLRAGELDDQLTYRKGLRRKVQEYTRTTPPHVAAARLSTTPNARIIAYRQTLAGPEPLDNLQHPLDYEHYLEKQVLPVAEPVLQVMGLSFAQVIGDDRQIDLF